jgi:hypothetical protein
VARSPILESISVAIGPIVLPAPMLEWPRSVVPGRIVVSPAISTSASIQVAPGSSIVTPARIWPTMIRLRASWATRARSARSLIPRFTPGSGAR